MYRVSELETRLGLLVKIIEIFNQSKTELTAKDVQMQLAKQNISVAKKVINSILFSEGKRYVSYKREVYKYSLVEFDPKDVRVDSLEIDYKTNGGTSAEDFIPSVYICNRSYSFSYKAFSSLQLFSVSEHGAKITVYINEEHPFIQKHANEFKKEGSKEKVVFEDYLIGLVNLSLNTPSGALRERVDDYLYSLSKELRDITIEKAQ